MRTLYVSQQGCYVCKQQESILIKQRENILAEVQLPLLEQILIFGKSQVTTEVIRTCLWRNIAIAYLSRMGFCYGRIIPIERGYRQLARYQQQLSEIDRLIVARKIVQGKLKNGRVFLKRQQRSRHSANLDMAIQSLAYLQEKAGNADNIQQLMGFEGAGAVQYFSGLGECLDNEDFVFAGRSRQPPGNPVNAMLSFGYQILWNHLLSLIEIQGLDPYFGCLHQPNEKHASLASDLIEEFRTPIVDSLVLYLVNRRMLSVVNDFVYRDGGCYLNDTGRSKYLKAFVQRMEEEVQNDPDSGDKQPKWDLLTQQVKAFKQFVYNPIQGYKPYQIR
jgi:CRISPR-associated protein Cas1